jgi:HEAT repeat protein
MDFIRILFKKKQLSEEKLQKQGQERRQGREQQEIKKLLLVVQTEDDPERSADAALALINIGKPAYRPFVDLLASPDDDIRERAIKAIEDVVYRSNLEDNTHAIHIVRAALKRNRGSIDFLACLNILQQLDDPLGRDLSEAMRNNQDVRVERLLNTIKLP